MRGKRSFGVLSAILVIVFFFSGAFCATDAFGVTAEELAFQIGQMQRQLQEAQGTDREALQAQITCLQAQLLAMASGGLGPLTVLSPNGGENWIFGANHKIIWFDGKLDAQAVYRVSLFKQDGLLSGVIGNVTGRNSIDWPTSSLDDGHLGFGAGSDYRVQIARQNFDGRWDQSDVSFSIISPIKVLSPNGGEMWQVGNTYHITWDTIGEIPEVQIGLRDTRYSSEVGAGEATIAPRIPNTGSYDFTVPASLDYLSNGPLDGSTYQVIVYPYSGSIGDLGDGTFSIRPADVPEPGTWALIGTGLLAGIGLVWRRMC